MNRRAIKMSGTIICMCFRATMMINCISLTVGAPHLKNAGPMPNS